MQKKKKEKPFAFYISICKNWLLILSNYIYREESSQDLGKDEHTFFFLNVHVIVMHTYSTAPTKIITLTLLQN